MITDKDIEKLKTVFATKDDLKAFATKDDLKNEIAKNNDVIVKQLGDMIQNTVISVLNKHERQIDRLEKAVGGFSPID